MTGVGVPQGAAAADAEHIAEAAQDHASQGDALLADALLSIQHGLSLCRCASRYHAVWGALKAAGAGRGLQNEMPVLAPLLRPLLAEAGHVLIAGAADAGSLRTLHALAGPVAPRFSVVDRCPAPLLRLAEVAAQLGINLRSQACDLAELVCGEPWDLVFAHYTLSFAGQVQRRRVLKALAQGLAPQGRLVCVAKFEALGPAQDPAAAASQWLQRLRPRIAAALASQPQTLAAVMPWLDAYAQDWALRKAAQPSPAELQADLAACGLQLVQQLDPSASGSAASVAASAQWHQQYSIVYVARRADPPVAAREPAAAVD